MYPTNFNAFTHTTTESQKQSDVHAKCVFQTAYC